MTEVKKGIGKTKVGLIISVVLVGILAVSNVWFFMRVEDLQDRIYALETDKNNLQSQVNSLQTDKSTLEGQVVSLQVQINALKASQLHLVNYEATVYDVWLGTDYVTVKGTIFNSGSNSATNVFLTIRIYDSEMTLLKTEQIAFGTIIGKSYENFDTDIYAEGAYYVTRALSYD